jgi:hypothetical protein
MLAVKVTLSAPGETAMQLGLAIISDGSKQQMAVQQGRL